jgi:hypothetical protein
MPGAGIFDIEAVEESIVERLSSLTAFDFQPIPQSESAHTKSIVKTRVSVAYGGAKFRDTEGMGNIVQRAERLFTVYIEGRRLRGDGGCYEALTEIPELLIGFEPVLCGKMFLKEEGPMERDSDLFKFAQVYSTYTLVQENLPEEEEPGLNEFTFTKS